MCSLFCACFERIRRSLSGGHYEPLQICRNLTIFPLNNSASNNDSSSWNAEESIKILLYFVSDFQRNSISAENWCRFPVICAKVNKCHPRPTTAKNTFYFCNYAEFLRLQQWLDYLMWAAMPFMIRLSPHCEHRNAARHFTSQNKYIFLVLFIISTQHNRLCLLLFGSVNGISR